MEGSRRSATVSGDSVISDAIEPEIADVLDARLARRRGSSAYHAASADVVSRRLTALFAANREAVHISGVRRMAGGASKEQFVFEAKHPDGTLERLVLRMEPIAGIIETSRVREAEVIQAMHGIVPVPQVRLVDAEGTHLGAPGLVTSFVPGVTKPVGAAGGVTGLGNMYDERHALRLGEQFVRHLAAIHAFDWSSASLPSFTAPQADRRQAALWQVGWWSRVWREDRIEANPVLTMAEWWLRENAPKAGDLVVVHGDYRMGNFLFDENTLDFTAVLDWELAHIGDFHEDLGWIVQRLYRSTTRDGQELICGLMPLDRFLDTYQQYTGREVDRRKLRFYELLAYLKCAVMNLSSGPLAAANSHSHQDVLLTWLSSIGHTFIGDIARILDEEDWT